MENLELDDFPFDVQVSLFDINVQFKSIIELFGYCKGGTSGMRN